MVGRSVMFGMWPGALPFSTYVTSYLPYKQCALSLSDRTPFILPDICQIEILLLMMMMLGLLCVYLSPSVHDNDDNIEINKPLNGQSSSSFPTSANKPHVKRWTCSSSTPHPSFRPRPQSWGLASNSLPGYETCLYLL